jgi:hypothetical protein
MALANDAATFQLALADPHVELNASIDRKRISQFGIAAGGADVAEQSLDGRTCVLWPDLDGAGA